MDFSDESDAEEVEPKAKAAVLKKRATAAASKAAGRGPRAAPETPLLEAPVKRPGRKKTTARPQPPSSEEDGG